MFLTYSQDILKTIPYIFLKSSEQLLINVLTCSCPFSRYTASRQIHPLLSEFWALVQVLDSRKQDFDWSTNVIDITSALLSLQMHRLCLRWVRGGFHFSWNQLFSSKEIPQWRKAHQVQPLIQRGKMMVHILVKHQTANLQNKVHINEI